MSIAIGGLYLEDPVPELENGNIESTAAKVIYRYLMVSGAFIQTIGKCRSGGFIDNPLHFQAGNPSRVFCCLALLIIEICRHGYDRP